MTEPAATDLEQRYGAPTPWRRPLALALTALLAAAFLGWVAWAAWTHGTPDAESALIGFDVQSDSSAIAYVDVQLDGEPEASCKVRAYAVDHTTVGEVSFTPEQGRNDVVVRTERRATSVELVGCVTSNQQRPR